NKPAVAHDKQSAVLGTALSEIPRAFQLRQIHPAKLPDLCSIGCCAPASGIIRRRKISQWRDRPGRFGPIAGRKNKKQKPQNKYLRFSWNHLTLFHESPNQVDKITVKATMQLYPKWTAMAGPIAE